MDSIQYIGELLWPGIAGRLAVVVCFVAAVAGAITFYKAAQPGGSRWAGLSRMYFGIHAAAVFAIIGLLMFILIAHRYEYVYAWEHVSDTLPLKYIFSAFWEGQEGSFLLWMFWHVILGGVLLFRNDSKVHIVMSVLLAVQAVITSMLLGAYITETFKIGSNPFLLLRDTMDAPIFSNPQYLTFIEGNGLNPLLQNYWMTIHPPTLFLGFAAATIPYCYALGGLIQKDHSGWLRDVLPWGLFAAGILGLGVLMGGAWAYEALTFGGYWAWDPVENMSLVPWIILIAAIHGNLIARKTGHSLRMTYAGYLLAFLLVLYSTFLTRSGVLGDSSAHAFTQMGLEWQLVIFIGIFGFLAVYFMIKRFRSIPSPQQEERTETREFWMFIGILVLFLSALLISFTTSIPVYNKIFDLTGRIFNADLSHLHRASPLDPIAHYNKYQLWIAAFIALLSAGAQYLRYREPSWQGQRSRFVKRIGISLLLAAAFTVVLGLWIDANAWQYKLLMFCAAFGVVANLDYLITYLRGNIKAGASAIAHFGFSVMVLGILASGLNEHVISTNVFAQRGLVDGVDPRTHIALIKGLPMYMNGYWVEYEQDTITGNKRTFYISYKRVNADHDTVERFTLRPNVLFNLDNTRLEATNPSTKRYWHKDIFTYVAALPAEQMNIEAAREIQDSLEYTPHVLGVGDTLLSEKYRIWPVGIATTPQHKDYAPETGDLAVQVFLKVEDLRRENIHDAAPLIYLRENLVFGIPDQINDLNLRIRLTQENITTAYPPDQLLEYHSFRMRKGDTIRFENTAVVLESIDRDAAHPHYTARDGDIAVNAVLAVRYADTSFIARPLFYIRDNRPAYLKSIVPDAGLHMRFENIYPQSEEFEFSMAIHQTALERIPFEIAEQVPRTDIIVLQAIVFPGINLFWLGSTLMMVGLFLAMWHKLKSKKTS